MRQPTNYKARFAIQLVYSHGNKRWCRKGRECEVVDHAGEKKGRHGVEWERSVRPQGEPGRGCHTHVRFKFKLLTTEFVVENQLL